MTYTLLVFAWLGSIAVPGYPDELSCEREAATVRTKLKGGGRVETVCVLTYPKETQ